MQERRFRERQVHIGPLHNVNDRFTASEKQLVREAAEREQQSLQSWVRSAVLRAAR